MAKESVQEQYLPAQAEVAALLKIAEERAVHGPIALPDGGLGYVLPSGMALTRIAPLEPALPSRVRQEETFIEPESFIDYLVRFRSSTAICRASLSSKALVAVARMGDLDWAQPGPAQHVVTLQCPFDLDYAKWRARFGKFCGQKEMLEFIEDMIHTIAAPPAADLLEAMGDIEIDRVVKFKSYRNDKTGNISIGYEEKDGDRTRSGEFSLPDHIDIVVPIFQGGPSVMLTAKLRLRMKDGDLGIGFSVPGIEVKERDAFRSIGEGVRSSTAVPVFYTA